MIACGGGAARVIILLVLQRGTEEEKAGLRWTVISGRLEARFLMVVKRAIR
jgi:hypothetical protein